jgi:tetratricopeptide (TPR) repeat protein
VTRDLQPEIETLYEKYVQDPDSRVFAPLADAYRKSGLLDEAIEICEKGLERYPDYSSAHVILAKCYYDQGATERAEESFRRVLDIDPENMVALQYLGDIQRSKGEDDQALASYRRLLALDPFNERVRELVEELRPPEHPAREEDPREPTGQAGPGAGKGLRPAETVGVEETIEEPAAARVEEEPTGEAEPVEIAEPPHFEEVAEEPPAHEPPYEDETREETVSAASAEMATLTLAGIYAAQGYRRKALSIYREILERDPLNEEVRALIARLEGEDRETEVWGPGEPERTDADRAEEPLRESPPLRPPEPEERGEEAPEPPRPEVTVTEAPPQAVRPEPEALEPEKPRVSETPPREPERPAARPPAAAEGADDVRRRATGDEKDFDNFKRWLKELRG